MRLMNSLIMICLVLLFSGCGQAGSEEEVVQGGPTSEETAKEEEQPTVEEIEPIEYPQFHSELQENERLVKMITSMGDITIKLFPEYAPLAVENFLTHSENGYYDGLLFHRVIKDFMIQTGDPLGNGTGGESIWDGPFEDEFTPSLGHYKGALSMANRGPNTNGSQFFIVQSDQFDRDLVDQLEQHVGVKFPETTVDLYDLHGGTPHLDYRHTVFGQVVEGIEIVDAIAEVEVSQKDRPVTDIIIERIEIIK